MKSVLLFISCAFFLVAATYLGQVLLTGQFSEVETISNLTEELVKVPTAKKALIAGEILYLTDVIWVDRPVPKGKQKVLMPANFSKNNEYFSVSSNVEEGALIEEGTVLRPTELNFLSNILKAEYRAMAVLLDEENLIASKLMPGSHIDLVLALDPNKKRFFADKTAVKLIAENIRVLSNSSFMNIKSKENGLALRKKAFNFIVEVSPDQSKTISFAREIGTLLPVLRPTKSGMTTSENFAKEMADTNIGDLTLFSDFKKEKGLPLELPQKIFIQRGNQLSTITRNVSEISQNNSADTTVGRKL